MTPAKFKSFLKLVTMQYQVILSTLFIFIIATSAWSASDKPIQLIYHERPPFYISQNDNAVTGLVAEPAARAFKSAGIKFEWDLIAANRQLAILKANQSRACAVGWFKNPEREKFSKYTTYIYQDKPMVAIFRSESVTKERYQMTSRLLADKNLKMGKKLGYSYGYFIDDMAVLHETQTITTTQNNTGLIRMLLADRFDYTFFPGDEADSLINEINDSTQNISIISLLDMPEGNKRYILCSQQVDNETINRLNAEIENARP